MAEQLPWTPAWPAGSTRHVDRPAEVERALKELRRLRKARQNQRRAHLLDTIARASKASAVLRDPASTSADRERAYKQLIRAAKSARKASSK